MRPEHYFAPGVIARHAACNKRCWHWLAAVAVAAALLIVGAVL